MRSSGETPHADPADPLRAVLWTSSSLGRIVLVVAILTIVASPAIFHLTDAGPDKLRWRMYADASHLSIRYEVERHDGAVGPADLSRVDDWLAGRHRGSQLPHAICDEVEDAVVIRRLVGDRIEETWPC